MREFPLPPHTHMYNTHTYMCLYDAVYHIDSLPGARTEYTEITSNKDVSEQKFLSPGEAWEVVCMWGVRQGEWHVSWRIYNVLHKLPKLRASNAVMQFTAADILTLSHSLALSPARMLLSALLCSDSASAAAAAVLCWWRNKCCHCVVAGDPSRAHF